MNHIDWEIASDEAVMDRLREGDDIAFTVLFRRHFAVAERVARSYRLHGESEDVVADVFTALLKQARRGQGPTANVRAYVLVSVRHEAARRARHHVRVRATERERLPDEPVPLGHGQTDLAEVQLLGRAMSRLSPRQRRVLWATEVEGIRPRELAAQMGLKANAVSAIACRARRAASVAYLSLDTDVPGGTGPTRLI